MALNVLRGRSRDAADEEAPLEIGAPDSNIIGCPVCNRPIEANAGRCPGCGTRLMLGVPYRRAGIFVGVGAVVGMLFGAMSIGMVMSVANALDGPVTGVKPTASAGPNGPGPRASSGLDPTVPLGALSGVRQAVAIDARLASGVGALQSALSAQPFDTFAVVSILRSLAADGAVGADAASKMRGWTAGAAVQGQLASLYEAVRSTAREGLAKASSNTAGYKTSAKLMIKVLGGVAAADEATRALADSVGIQLTTTAGP